MLSLKDFVLLFITSPLRNETNRICVISSWAFQPKFSWSSWTAGTGLKIRWRWRTFPVVCGRTNSTFRWRSKRPRRRRRRRRRKTENSSAASAPSISLSNACWTVTWNATRTWSGTCARSAAKDSTTPSTWSGTRERIPAFGPTSAICARNPSRSAARWSRTASRSTACSTNTRTRSDAQRWVDGTEKSFKNLIKIYFFRCTCARSAGTPPTSPKSTTSTWRTSIPTRQPCWSSTTSVTSSSPTRSSQTTCWARSRCPFTTKRRSSTSVVIYSHFLLRNKMKATLSEAARDFCIYRELIEVSLVSLCQKAELF